MRHNKHRYKLNVSPSHRISLMRNLATAIITHGKIKSTHAKCMAIRPYVEKLITLAKVDSVANRRRASQKLADKQAVAKLFTEVGPKYVDRKGGYTRVLKLADGRVGDNAKMSYIALVD